MPDLKKILARLKAYNGAAELPPAIGPFQLVLWENAVYLMPDERRAEVFIELRHRVGLTARAIEDASDELLLEIARRGGMRPETRVFRWRDIARITNNQYGGDLDAVLALPYAAAKKVLKQFPTIGDPGAEKILLFCGMANGLPLESNGLRVLVRAGFGRDQKSYGAMYKSVQEAIAGVIPKDALGLASAHLLLREHGQDCCRRQAPECKRCPVALHCDYERK